MFREWFGFGRSVLSENRRIGELAEKLCVAQLRRDGWTVWPTKLPGDQGVDICATKGLQTRLIEVKSGNAQLTDTKYGKQMSDPWIKRKMAQMLAAGGELAETASLLTEGGAYYDRTLNDLRPGRDPNHPLSNAKFIWRNAEGCIIDPPVAGDFTLIDRGNGKIRPGIRREVVRFSRDELCHRASHQRLPSVDWDFGAEIILTFLATPFYIAWYTVLIPLEVITVAVLAVPLLAEVAVGLASGFLVLGLRIFLTLLYAFYAIFGVPRKYRPDLRLVLWLSPRHQRSMTREVRRNRLQEKQHRLQEKQRTRTVSLNAANARLNIVTKHRRPALPPCGARLAAAEVGYIRSYEDKGYKRLPSQLPQGGGYDYVFSNGHDVIIGQRGRKPHWQYHDATLEAMLACGGELWNTAMEIKDALNHGGGVQVKSF